jgi:hypothetical protein
MKYSITTPKIWNSLKFIKKLENSTFDHTNFENRIFYDKPQILFAKMYQSTVRTKISIKYGKNNDVRKTEKYLTCKQNEWDMIWHFKNKIVHCMLYFSKIEWMFQIISEILS